MSNASSRPFWPRTLYGRLLLVLVMGMLLAQALTGTIWFDLRYERVQEIPARLAGARIGQALRILEAPGGGDAGLGFLSGADFSIEPLAAAPEPMKLGAQERSIQALIGDALTAETGSTRTAYLRAVRSFDDRGQEGKRLAVYTAKYPSSEFLVDGRTSDGRWYRMRVMEGQAGLQQQPLHALGEYALRVYGVRTALILLLALFLVHWLTRPLTRLAQAAKVLGRDLHAPPLPLAGPLEVRDATEAFNQMQARLARAVSYRDELLAAVSHDLRSPITRMRLRTEMIADEAARERLRTELAQMQALVDSILEYLAAGATPGPVKPVDIHALVQAVVEDVRDMGHDVMFEGHPGAIFNGDAQGLRRALTNLVDNAVRYGKRARVRLEGRTITIDDEGPGIPDEALERVLEPFFRLPASRNADIPGTGLGLSIARQLLYAQGGGVTLRNLERDGIVRGLRVTVML